MERRQSPRHEVDRPAKIAIPGGDALPCRITNESDGGMKLYVYWKGWLPKAFTLQDVFTGARRAVQTVWMQFSSMGVRFRDPKPRETRHSEFGRRRSD
jgi:hypothetical protein